MLKATLFTCLSLIFSTQVWAGNGVERGHVIERPGEGLPSEIFSYLNRKMSKCPGVSDGGGLSIKTIEEVKDRVDQGIIDIYYYIHLDQKDSSGNTVNTLSVEVVDVSYSNWKSYDEKLSIRIIEDQNRICQ